MDLLERDAALGDLHAALDDALRGEGRVALVSGEAGIGKTSVVERFARAQGAGVCLLWGGCDALYAPRPLGPLHEIAAHAGDALANTLTGSTAPGAIFGTMLAELQRQPSIMVVDDVHWADDATLDVLRYLGRRIGRTSALLVLTYRDDELAASGPLRRLLGDLASSATTVRLHLPPLSEAAVRVLIGQRVLDASALHRQTGGNPFFITEILANAGESLPQSIRDAVLGRVARISGSGVALLEAAAVCGSRVEGWLLAAMLPADYQGLDECVAGGMLVEHDGFLAFRHELARQTVVDSIAPVRRARLHRLALRALETLPSGDADLARLAHHAEGANDDRAILTYVPAAARQGLGGWRPSDRC